MGEAATRKKRQLMAKLALNRLDMDKVALAVKTTCDALTDARGYDCQMYAQVGAGLLGRLGVTAKPVAGGAAWRVGPGDGDVLNHFPDRQGSRCFRPDVAMPTTMFHAWINVQDLLVDFTTWSLTQKAQQLDAADGGQTQVEWAPEYLCTPIESALPYRDVVQGEGSGLFSYVRIEALERMIFAHCGDGAFDEAIAVALYTYHMLLSGDEVKVVCLDESTGNQSPDLVVLEEVG
jgi:hypothetical protein